MVKKTKWITEYIVQGNYGYGWDDLTFHNTRAEANKEKKVYDANEKYAHRVIARKVKNENIGAIRKKAAPKKAAKKSTLKTPPVYMSKRQTGTSNKEYDKRKKALPAGKRISANTGKAYYEYRKNRTDKPGTMLGIGEISLNDVGTELLNLEIQINSLKEKKKFVKLLSEKKEISYKISILSKQFKTLKLYLNSRAKFI